MVAWSPLARSIAADSASRPSGSLASARPMPSAPPAAMAARSSSKVRVVLNSETEKRGIGGGPLSATA
jgi:hypothetical protein